MWTKYLIFDVVLVCGNSVSMKLWVKTEYVWQTATMAEVREWSMNESNFSNNSSRFWAFLVFNNRSTETERSQHQPIDKYKKTTFTYAPVCVWNRK